MKIYEANGMEDFDVVSFQIEIVSGTSTPAAIPPANKEILPYYIYCCNFRPKI
jgi:hypothetical protein